MPNRSLFQLPGHLNGQRFLHLSAPTLFQNQEQKRNSQLRQPTGRLNTSNRIRSSTLFKGVGGDRSICKLGTELRIDARSSEQVRRRLALRIEGE
jgi:hypothetical protein